MIIAIDGPSGTGKSTIAQLVAHRLGFVYFNTGAMYRSLAFYVSEKGVDPHDAEEVIVLLDTFVFDIRKTNGKECYFVNGRDVTEQLYQEQISFSASIISSLQEVRSHLLPIQRNFAASHDAVFEGRDIGTVVFPGADLKIFLTARPEVRADRRVKQLKEKYPDKKYDPVKVLEDIEERDVRDSTRAIAPLKAAEDAFVIDTSDMSIVQVVDKIIEMVP